MRKPGKPSSAKAERSSLVRVIRPLSLVAQVELSLRQAITDDGFPNGKLPTEVELAEQLGVSRETVRLAAEALQREGLLVKIRHRGTFTRPPRIPGQIKAVEAKLLGYLQTEFVGAHGQEEVTNRAISGLLLQGALAEAGNAGFQLVVQHTSNIHWRQAVCDLSAGGRLRGLICTAYNEEKMLRRLAASGLPTVVLDDDTNVPRIHSVRDDCFEGARQAIAHLAKLGHRRIAYAHWDRADMNRWRLMGYRKGLRDAGLTHRRHREILTEMTEAGSCQMIDRLLALAPPPTALYCFNNTLAGLAVAELRRRSVRVPEDMSVLGAGGEDVPGVTCHQTDWYLMGRAAVQILLRALTDLECSQTEHLLSTHTLRPGLTTAAPGR
jgi:LacI family transcriptional regulator